MNAELPEPYVLRRIARDEVGDACALVATCFDDDPKADPAVAAWQWWDGPGGDPATFMIRDASTACDVAHFTVFNVPGRWDGEPVLIGKSADAATLPEARGKRLFGHLIRASTEAATETGAPVSLYAPSNPASRAALDREGFVAVAPLDAFVLPVDGQAVSRTTHLPRRLTDRLAARAARRRLTRDRSIVVTPTTRLPDDLDALVASNAATVDGVVRDSAFWRWRVARPGAEYAIWRADRGGRTCGFAVVLRRAMVGVPTDCVLGWAGGADGLAAIIAALHRSTDASMVAGVGIVGTPSADALAGAGLVRVPRRLLDEQPTVGLIGPGARPVDPATFDLQWVDLDNV